MKTKHKIYFLLLILIMPSCKKEEFAQNDDEIREMIVGTWRWKAKSSFTTNDDYEFLEFTSDGRYRYLYVKNIYILGDIKEAITIDDVLMMFEEGKTYEKYISLKDSISYYIENSTIYFEEPVGNNYIKYENLGLDDVTKILTISNNTLELNPRSNNGRDEKFKKL